MNNIKKLLCLLLVFVMLASMVACAPNNDTPTTDGPDNSTPGGQQNTPIEYQVTVKSIAGVPMKAIDLTFYDENGEMVNVARTNDNGVAKCNLVRKDGYTVSLNGVPAGYTREASYALTGSNTVITLLSGPIQGVSVSSDTTWNVGDIVYDLSITDTEGNEITISELLEEKKVVILNFFYTTCGPCINEVPAMEQAYKVYEDDVEILGLNCYARDNEEGVALFKETYGLSFPMAKVSNTWASLAYNPEYGDSTYPTTYVIDRYGMICIKEFGSVASLGAWSSIMDYFSAESYVQTLCPNGFGDIVTSTPPNVDNDTPDQLAGVLGNADGNIVFGNDESEENTYTWPFKTSTENKLGVPCVYASNMGYDSSYSILIAQVTLKKGQAIGFDYLVSTESGADVLYVIVNDTPIYNVSGFDDEPQWHSLYPWVAQEDGTYQVVITYIKDDSQPLTDELGQPVKYTDEVYLSNFRILDSADEIDTETYLPTDAFTENADYSYSYPEIFFNEADGYYHVGAVDGPLLLANMVGSTELWDKGIYEMALEGEFKIGDTDYARLVEIYANYATKSKKTYYCTVNYELAEVLKACADLRGFSGDEYEWLQLCMYYRAYGTNGRQMEDPIAGVAFFSALTAVEGENIMPYDEGIALLPRGKVAKFVPTRTGVYRITTHLPLGMEANGFIFPDTDKHLLDVAGTDGVYEHEDDERMYYDGGNISMVYYMVAGQTYYIDVCFYDMYQVGQIPYTIEFEGESYALFRRAASTVWIGTETEDGGLDGGNLQRQGIPVMIGEDGYLYHNVGTAENPVKGSQIYLDMIGTQINLGDIPIYSSGKGGVLNLHGFDFRLSAEEQTLQSLKDQGYDTAEKLDDYLRTYLGQNYDALIGLYDIEGFLAGNYTGIGVDKSVLNQKYLRELITGLGLDVTKYEIDEIVKIDGVEYKVIQIGDCTEAVRAYLDKLIPDDGNNNPDMGCVAVDTELVLYLQLIIDTHGFQGVQDSWLKLCYYYDYMGAADNLN